MKKAIGCSCAFDCTLDIGTCVCPCHKMDEVAINNTDKEFNLRVIIGFDKVFDMVKKNQELEVVFVRGLFIHQACYFKFVCWLQTKGYYLNRGVFSSSKEGVN